MLARKERRAVDFSVEASEAMQGSGEEQGSATDQRVTLSEWYSGPRLPLLYNGDKGGIYLMGHGAVSKLACVEQVEWYSTSEAIDQCLLL